MSTEPGDRLAPTPPEQALSTGRHPDQIAFDRALAEDDIRQLAEELGYGFHTLTDGTIVLEPRPNHDHCGICAYAAEVHDRAARTRDAATHPLKAFVVLPEPDELDDDGQLWFDDYEIRVDTTGSGPAAVYVGGKLRHLDDGLERHAAALLAAIAAARSAS